MAGELLRAAFRGGDEDDEHMGFALVAEWLQITRDFLTKK